MKMFCSILLQKSLVVRRTIRPQFLVVLTYFVVAEDTRTLEFCYPAHTGIFDVRAGNIREEPRQRAVWTPNISPVLHSL